MTIEEKKSYLLKLGYPSELLLDISDIALQFVYDDAVKNNRTKDDYKDLPYQHPFPNGFIGE